MAHPGVVVLASSEEPEDGGTHGSRAYRLEGLFRELNRELTDRLHAGFQLRKGAREFGAILEDGAAAGDVLLRVWAELHPARTRTVFVPGPVRVQTELWDGGGSEGPAGLHHFAGPPLDRAEELLRELGGGPSLLSVDVEGEGERPWLEQLGTVLQLRLAEWTPRQLETYRTYRRLGSQRRTARELGVTQPTVSECLSRIDARATTEALSFFTSRLDRALERATARVAEEEEAGTAG